jgi:hypothetical protein
MDKGREGAMRTTAPRVVTTALALRGLLFLGGVLTGAVMLLAAIAGKKGKK